jgi:hypothetical protein
MPETQTTPTNLRRRRLATRALRWVRENRPDVIELLEQEMNDGQD